MGICCIGSMLLFAFTIISEKINEKKRKKSTFDF